MERLSTVTDTPRAFLLTGQGDLIFKAGGKVHRRRLQQRHATNWPLQWVRYQCADYLVDSVLDITAGAAVADAWFNAGRPCPSHSAGEA